MTPESTVRAYYDALRKGESLAAFFLESPAAVKYGIGERLDGYAAIADGLGSQTARTREWTVESDALQIVDRGDHAAVSDRVRMEWYDTDDFETHAYDTRWSGTLTRTDDSGVDSADATAAGEDVVWKFAGMHVSVAGPTEE